MSVAICSILAAKISTEETSELGSHASYMKKLLSIVRNRFVPQNPNKEQLIQELLPQPMRVQIACLLHTVKILTSRVKSTL